MLCFFIDLLTDYRQFRAKLVKRRVECGKKQMLIQKNGRFFGNIERAVHLLGRYKH